MVKKIETLIEDIEAVLKDGLDVVPDEIAEAFGKKMADLLRTRLKKQERSAGLRMSNIGSPCERKLWFQINQGGDEEVLDASTKFKFLYGDVIEEVLLALAELGGHSVQGRQDELSISGIKGHRDAVIDGVTVDVKSASSYSYSKFRSGNLHSDDPFGYVDQLQSYIEAGQSDDLVTDKLRGAFLVADKTLGHICLDFHQRDDSRNLAEEFERKKGLMAAHVVPARSFNPEPDGKSGNKKLPTFCSYCNVKHTCHKGIRTFLYSTGPRYLTEVKKEPNVPELLR